MKSEGSNSTLFSLIQSIFASNSKWFTAYDTTVTTAARVTRLTASPTTSTRTATSITIAQGRIAEGFGHWMDKSGPLLFICISTKTLSHAACHPWSIQRSEIVTVDNLQIKIGSPLWCRGECWTCKPRVSRMNLTQQANSMHLRHETSLLSTPLPFWTCIIILGK